MHAIEHELKIYKLGPSIVQCWLQNGYTSMLVQAASATSAVKLYLTQDGQYDIGNIRLPKRIVNRKAYVHALFSHSCDMVSHSATTADWPETPQFFGDTNIEFYRLEIDDQFKSLTKEERLYAHWMSRYLTLLTIARHPLD